MISAKIVADSICPRGNRLTTLEVIMPRYILAEFNTHRMLSRNSASSRAIPLKKMIQSVRDNGFKPYAWQKDHKGMQGTEYHTDPEKIEQIENFWEDAKQEAIISCSLLNDEDVTKQLANRLLEPFMYHKVLVSATEWENFFNLRCPRYSFESKVGVHNYKSRKEAINNIWEANTDHENGGTILEWLQHNKGQSDIHMMFLAEVIYDARNESIPKKLNEGEWHIPYGDDMDFTKLVVLGIDRQLLSQKENIDDYYNNEDEAIVDSLRNKISVARCARLSYQTLGDNPVIDYDADLKLYDILAKSGHFSPFEHVAKVMTEEEYYKFTKGKVTILDMKPQKDIIVVDNKNIGWCNNFKGFIQERYILEQSWNKQ